jgi:hypothetical protein
VFIAFWNLGFKWYVDLDRIVLVCMGVLWFLIGDIISHSERGWFFGWFIFRPAKKLFFHNEQIMEDTGKYFGKSIKVASVFMIISIVFPINIRLYIAIWPFIVPLLIWLVYPRIAIRKLKNSNQ